MSLEQPSEVGDDAYLHRTALMGTVVSITVVGHRAEPQIPRSAQDDGLAQNERKVAVERAIAWVQHVERVCSRFDPKSELSRLTARPGVAMPLSAVLFQALRFAMALAEETRGAFDPTVGGMMASRGFDVDYRTGARGPHVHEPAEVWYRDLQLDLDAQTATVLCPMTLDLGAVAKGLAVDLAARELRDYPNICIEAGGDGYVRGSSGRDGTWTVGIRHPRDPHHLLDSVRVTNTAVCTSGDYERRTPQGGYHILDPRTGESPHGVASVTVIAPTTMLADGLGTAAFVLGPEDGLALLERHGAEGLMVTPALDRFETNGFRRFRQQILRFAQDDNVAQADRT